MKTTKTNILLVIVAFFLLAGLLLPQTEIVNRSTKLEQMVAITLPAVVHIKCDTRGWQGSGVIISPDGVVLTAAHIIGSGGNTFTVTLYDGRKFTTNKSCVVKKYDVGYLKLEAKNLPTVQIVDVSNLRLGAQLFAIGSQFGEKGFNSVTMGILSARKRSVENVEGWSIVFQSDVGANPGSSGGPVFDIDGSLVGIVVGGPTEIYAGIVYCIPSEIFIKYIDAARTIFVLQDVKDTMVAEKIAGNESVSEEPIYHSFCGKN